MIEETKTPERDTTNSKPENCSGNQCSHPNHGQPLTIAALADAISLPVEFLSKLGLREEKRGVWIPYFHEDGSPAPRSRLQKDLSGPRGFRWGGEAQQTIVPYGLWRLLQARSEGYVILVDSEVAWWILTYHGFPALAIPSPNMVKVLQLKHLDQIDRAYVVHDTRSTSEPFSRGLQKRLDKVGWAGELYVISLPDGIADLQALHKSNPDGFNDVLRAAIESAKPSSEGKGARDDRHGPKLTKQLSDAIKAEEHFAQDAGGRLYIYKNGVYTPGAEDTVSTRAKELMEKMDLTRYWGTGTGPAVAEFIRLGAPRIWETPPKRIINVKNGLLDIDTLQQRPHSPDHLSPVQAPIEYDPQATCPEIDKFIGEIFPEDTRDLAYEILGDLLVPDRSIQKAILLIGEGGNGKSAFLELATNFVGRDNVSHVSLHDLEKNRFAKAELQGKLANICADLPSGDLAGTSVFKSVTGGDRVAAERKFQPPFQFKPFCRLLFSANLPPQSNDDSKAFYDRWIVVPLRREFRGTDQDVPRAILDARLSTPRELSGLLNKALVALERLQKTGRFSESKITREALANFERETDPLAVWLDRHTVLDPNAEIAQAKLREAYNRDCEQHHRRVMSPQAFGRALKRYRPELQNRQQTIYSSKEWMYVGIDLIDDPVQLPGSEELAA